MTAHFKQKILKACSNHAKATAAQSNGQVWGPVLNTLGIPAPLLSLLAPRILILPFLHFHLPAQVSLLHVNAITDIR